MTSVLLDTVGLIAVWDVDDQWHAAAEMPINALFPGDKGNDCSFLNAAMPRLDVPFGVMSVPCDKRLICARS